ncbi:hypothetical protein CHS0354_012814 [Potamilus streckersoni]|uniref:Sorting nexin-25 n=1 Tax=Potamilus streckersoni TaxID=2493646 RepID=A0AAE0SWI1_9BIVA|nr:hypothetical protein CHS0354_012814 [Potamilus streckersoni]
MFTITAHVVVAGIGVYLGVSWSLIKGKKYAPPTPTKEVSKARIAILNLVEKRAEMHPDFQKKVVISRNMDLAIQEVLNLVIRDFVLSWFQDLSRDQETMLTFLKADMWQMIETLSTKFSKLDLVKLVTNDAVNRLNTHFRDIRLATKRRNKEAGTNPTFVLHPWLKSDEDEEAFIRKVSETLLLLLLPKTYTDCPPILHLLREIFTTKVLKPSIDLICDPDYINQKLISYIEYREKLSEDTRRTYTYAATYEEFVKMIEKCDDIEHLKQLRFNIITEIMQATTINNLKKAQGTNSDKQGSPKSLSKGELLKARNLKRYINQLTVAKSRCEKKIYSLGGPDYKYYTEDISDETTILPGQKVFSFAVIMDSPSGREYFMSYLKRDDKQSLLGFWIAVEKLQGIDKRQHHQFASEIYHQYIASSTTAVKVDRTIIKGMESFMLGNTGPDAFFEAQKQVYQILEEQHYPSFLVSDIYHRYITSLDEDVKGSVLFLAKDELFFEPKDGWVESDEDDMDIFLTQSYHAQQKLQQLDSKIQNKSQALEALRGSMKADPKMKKLEEEMEKEVENLRLERQNLGSHILRTQQWWENHGKWRAYIYETETCIEAEKKTPLFVIVVHLPGTGNSRSLQSSTQGWVVSRKLADFHTVHEKLIQIGPWLKKKELPSMNIFTTVDSKFLAESTTILNDYLQAVMKDERMAQSEALYGFLTPSPEYFQPPVQEKKITFLKNFFRNLPSIGTDTRETDEELIFTGDEGTKEDRSKDSIAEPLYCLISEVFELQGMFKWLRKSFIAFVEITFGRSINRQLRETVYWLFTESMMIYYIGNFKDSMWPDGKLAEALPVRTNEQKLRTRMKAKDKFLKNMPEAVKSLVGDDNAKRGAIKMFEVFQDVRLNKHLFYVLLELLLFELFPELKNFSPDADTVNIEENSPLKSAT